MTCASFALRDAAPQGCAVFLLPDESAELARRTATPADVTLHLARHHWFVRFYPALAAKLGNFKAALFLGHALYWTRHLADKQQGRDGWFYMSAAQCQEVTGLTTREQGRVRRLLRELGLIEEKLAGVPATLHYRVNLSAMLQWAGIVCEEPGSDAAALKAIDRWLWDSIRFYRPLADIAGSVAGGLYLSLLVQKQREWRGADGFTKMPQCRISEILTWGAKTQRNAREKLKASGLLQERERGAWICVDMDELMEQLSPRWNEQECTIEEDIEQQVPADAKAKMTNAVFPLAPASAVCRATRRFLQPSVHPITLAGQAQMPLFERIEVDTGQQQAKPEYRKARRMFELPPTQGLALLDKTRVAEAERQTVLTKGQVALSSKVRPAHASVGRVGSSLVMPKGLNSLLYEAALRTVVCFAPIEQQMLLDELAGQMAAKRIANPIGYLHALVKKHKDGGLVLALAGQVAEQRAWEMERRKRAEQQAQAKPKRAVTSEEVQAAKERLKQLRSEMKASAADMAAGRRKVA